MSNTKRYSNRLINPLFNKNNAINFALLFWISATKEHHPTRSVNDFMRFLNWDEDDFPMDSLLRQYPRTRTTFLKNVKAAFEVNDIINKRLRKNWVEYTFSFWRDARIFYGELGDHIDTYLDFLQLKDTALIDTYDIALDYVQYYLHKDVTYGLVDDFIFPNDLDNL